MTFTATHTRRFIGTDITATVNAGVKESIAAVTVTYDGELLEEQEFADGTESYSRTFAQVGGSSPGAEHTLVVTAVDAGGAPHSATTRWSDG
jgi:hypothetical protein